MIKLSDIILAIVCGESAAFVIGDFLKEIPGIGIIKILIFFIGPILGLLALWVAHLIVQRFLFVYQFVKYVLNGILATAIDLEAFGALILIFGVDVGAVYGIAKGISFILSSSIKFVGNKFWVFEKNGKDGIKEEVIGFLIVTFVGLILDVGIFLYFSKVIGPHFSFSIETWNKICVVLAGIGAVTWNFIGNKFIVFKK